MSSLTVSTPGKLILMGEHAVVFGHPALVASVDLRLRAVFSIGDEEGSVEIRLPRLSHTTRVAWKEVLAYTGAARARWEEFASAPNACEFDRVRGDDPAHIVKVALGEAVTYLGEDVAPPLRLEVDSELPIGSGFGSSAALAVAVVGGYLTWRGGRRSREVIEGLALRAEQSQHGFPSGVDSATVLGGGLVWAERTDAGQLEVSPIGQALPALASFRVFDSGTPAESTGVVVAAVRDRLSRHPRELGSVLDELGRTTLQFREALLAARDIREIVSPVRRYEAGLERLGVVPPRVQELVRRVEEEGGAAKISGAGSLSSRSEGPPGAGCLLLVHPEPERIDEWNFLEGLRSYDVTLGGEGFRQDEP